MKTNNPHGHVEIDNLQLNFHSFALKDINLDISAGEYFVLLGPTGSGKTVLLEAIAGLQSSQSGRIVIDGQDITNLVPEKRGIGFVYQDYALFPHLTVAQNITLGLAARNRSQIQHLLPMFSRNGRKDAQRGIKAQLHDTTRLLRIDHLLKRMPEKLSGGEKQRVALARALIVRPRLMLLDEPLSSLDPERREVLQRELLRIHQEVGTTTIHVTHDFEEAIALGDRIAVIHDGEVLQVGSPETIFRHPASEFVARFVGARNIFESKTVQPTMSGTTILTHNGLNISTLTSLSGKLHYSIRPEDIIIAREKLHSSVRNCFEGQVTTITNKGMLVYVTVDVTPEKNQFPPTPFVCAITRSSYDEMSLHIGDRVTIGFKASAVHVF